VIRPTSLPDFEVESRLRQGEVTPGRPGVQPPKLDGPISLSEALVQFERELILAAIERCGGNLTRAAQQLELSRHALRYRMSRLSVTIDGTVDEDSDSSPTSAGR
jgi:DNA-binding NtrC family response regulator